MDILKTVLCSLLSVGTLFIITKIMGHKQVAQLDFFDYISGITIGSIAAEMATDLESPWQSLTALVIYGAVSLLLDLITHKIPKSRKFINGSPTILMDGGKIFRKNLKKAKLDLSEFLLLCREQGYFDLSDIQTAVFEHNGKLSVLPTPYSRPATPRDLSLSPNTSYMGVEIIMDGRIMGENLQRAGKDEVWLKKQLKNQGYGSPDRIFLAIYRKEDNSLDIYAVE